MYIEHSIYCTRCALIFTERINLPDEANRISRKQFTCPDCDAVIETTACIEINE